MSIWYKFFDQISGATAIVTVVVGFLTLYHTAHFLTWPKVEAQVSGMRATCMAWKPNPLRKIHAREYYPCADLALAQQASHDGYTEQGARTLAFDVRFNTIDGRPINTTISDMEQEVSNDDRLARVWVRYSKSSPQEAEFADVVASLAKQFGVVTVFGALIAFGSRKAKQMCASQQ